MDNAMHFFDEIKKGMQHQVEQAIEDWDYQDFSPDKRRALLEEQVTNDVADDLQPESDAIQHIHDSRQQLNWSGLSPEDELAGYDCGSDAMAANATGYESKVVIMSTPAGGIQGVPDADTLHRFMNKAQHTMNPQALTQALVSRLQDPNSCWQIRSKVLVFMHALIESVPLAPHYLTLFKQSIQMMQLVEKLRTSDHNHIVRENARKALSLVQSNGANSMLIPREANIPKQLHARHTASELTSVRKSAKPTSSSANTATVKRATKTQPPPAAIKVNHHHQDAKDNKHLHTSPKIARAALASWRRRNSQGSQDEMDTSQDNPNLLPFQRPPQMTMQSKQQVVAMTNNSNGGFGAGESSHITTSSSSNVSRYQSGQIRPRRLVATTTMTTPEAVRPAVKQQQADSDDSAPQDVFRAKKHRSSNVFWIKLNFTVKTARLQSLKRHKYQHLQEEALLKARGLLKNWEDGPVLLIEDLYRQAAAASLASGDENNEDANELLNYTPEALALRFSLRNDPGVLDAVKELWMIDTGPRDALGCIDQRAYTALFRRIAKSVDAEAFPRRQHQQRKHKRMEKNIHEDWKRDSKGETQMSFANFFDSVFELADLWCETIQVDEYVSFLQRIRDRISEKKNLESSKASSALVSNKRVLRPMTKVKALDEDTSEEEEESESESESESTSEESEESEESSEDQEDQEDQVEPVRGDESGAFAHTSMVHRFLTAKTLEVTPKNTNVPHKLPHQLSRKTNSAAGALGTQPQRATSRAGTPPPAAGRFSSTAYQQQLLLQRQQRNRHPSAVSTVRFGDDGSGRLELVSNDSGGDLSARVEGAAFQPGTTAIGGDPVSPQTKLSHEDSSGDSASASASGSEKRTSSLVMNGAPGSKPSGDIVILDTRLRAPTIAVHVVESGIDGIFNSATKQTDHFDTTTSLQQQQQQSKMTSSGLFASTTRSAMLKMGRAPHPRPNLLGSGFRDVVFNAMQEGGGNSSGGSQSSGLMALASANFDASHFGNIVGEQLHAGPAGTSSSSSSSTTTTGVAVSAIASSHSAMPKSSYGSGESSVRPTSSSLPTGERLRAPLPRQSHLSPIVAAPSENSSASSRLRSQSGSYPFSASAAGAAASTSMSPLRTSTLKQNGRERQSKSSQQQQQRVKRVLPSMMSPLQQPSPSQSKILYRFDDLTVNSNNSSNNNSPSSHVDLSTSYTTTSYALDSGCKSNNSMIKASANNSLSLSSLDPHAKSSSSAAPLWYGLRPTKETKDIPGNVIVSKRLKTLPATRTTTRKVDIGGFDRQQQQKMKYPARGGVNDEMDLNASPWNTYDDLDDGFGSDLLLGRDWHVFSLAETPPQEDEGGNDLAKPHDKQRQKQKSKQNGCSGSGSESRTYGNNSALSLIVTSLGTLQQLQHSLSVPETGNNRTLPIVRDESSNGMTVSASSSALSAPSGNKVHPDYQAQLHDQLVLTGAAQAGLSSEIEQLQSTKLPLHLQSQPKLQQLPRNASRKKGFGGWNNGSGLPNDNELMLRGERKSKPSLPSSTSPDSDRSRPGDEATLGGGGGRLLSPIRAVNRGVCGCSQSEKRPDCSFEHCEAAARQSLLYRDDGGETRNERPKSPVFKMERHVGTLDDKPERENLHHHHHQSRNREAMDNVTILLNANREIILRPKKQVDELAELVAMSTAPTRSQMMKRRYKYTFGKT